MMPALPWLLTIYIWGVSTPMNGQPIDTLMFSPVDKQTCLIMMKEKVDRLKAEHPTWQFGSRCTDFDYKDPVLYSR